MGHRDSRPGGLLYLVTNEVIRCGEMVRDMLLKVYRSSEKNEVLVLTEIKNEGNALRDLYLSINDYLNEMFAQGVMTEEQAGESTRLMYILCDIDRIGSLCREVTQNVIEQDKDAPKLSKEAARDLKKSVKLIYDMYEYALDAMTSGDPAHIKDIQKKKEDVVQMDDRMRRQGFLLNFFSFSSFMKPY